MTAMIEREIKLKIINLSLDEIFKKLKQDNLEFLGEEKEIDIYFNSTTKDFRKTDEVVRIREIDNDEEIELTYKGPKIGTISKSREEITIRIPQKYKDNLFKILEKLGLIPLYKVTKIRKYFRDGNFTICLDEVNDLGSFVEIELPNGSEEELIKYVNSFLNRYSIIAEKIDKSYLELILSKNE